jgi:hypothetical protein
MVIMGLVRKSLGLKLMNINWCHHTSMYWKCVTWVSDSCRQKIQHFLRGVPFKLTIIHVCGLRTWSNIQSSTALEIDCHQPPFGWITNLRGQHHHLMGPVGVCLPLKATGFSITDRFNSLVLVNVGFHQTRSWNEELCVKNIPRYGKPTTTKNEYSLYIKNKN